MLLSDFGVSKFILSEQPRRNHRGHAKLHAPGAVQRRALLVLRRLLGSGGAAARDADWQYHGSRDAPQVLVDEPLMDAATVDLLEACSPQSMNSVSGGKDGLSSIKSHDYFQGWTLQRSYEECQGHCLMGLSLGRWGRTGGPYAPCWASLTPSPRRPARVETKWRTGSEDNAPPFLLATRSR